MTKYRVCKTQDNRNCIDHIDFGSENDAINFAKKESLKDDFFYELKVNAEEDDDTDEGYHTIRWFKRGNETGEII